MEMQRSVGIDRVCFSSKGAPCDTAVELSSVLPQVCGRFAATDFSIHLSGEYNFTNACAAIAVGRYFDIDPQRIADALATYRPDNNRSQWIHRGQHWVMMDAYNANPTSMALSVENFARTDTQGRVKVAVLGDMFELGSYAAQEHRNIVDLVCRLPFERVYLVGENFASAAAPTDKVFVYRTFEEFAQDFPPATVPSAYLVKGSRGMRMERLLDLL